MPHPSPNRPLFRNLCRVSGILLLTASTLRADVKVPSIFGDHMILQQDAPLPVWGIADAGEKVTVTAGADTAIATADADGKWRVTLSPLAGTATPLTMTVAGKNTLTFNDVLVGEVWIASGQSNMGFSLQGTKDAATEIPKADDPQLRFFAVNQQPSLTPSTVLESGTWKLVTPTTAGSCSGVAYYFSKALRAKLNRPVGMVQNPVGGTIAEAWTPLEALKKEPPLTRAVDQYEKVLAAFPEVSTAYPDKFAAWHTQRIQWETDVNFNPITNAWKADVAKATAAGQPAPPAPKFSPAPVPPPDTPWGGMNTPTVLFNSKVFPVIPYAIRGVIWYQGESNCSSWQEYHELFSRMITAWRDHWGQGDFPFLYVQLPNLDKAAYSWPLLREAQAQTLSVPHTAMAVAIDVGDPRTVHPADKSDVGQRLALIARHEVYGEKDLVSSGPVYDSMKVEGNAIRINFTHTGSGLTIGSSPWVAPGSTPVPTTSLLGFAVAGDNKQWFPADAKIDGNTVEVSSASVPNPVAVRYAWDDAPRCNLYNKEKLPAGPFRTDDWLDPKPVTPPAPTPAPSATAAQK